MDSQSQTRPSFFSSQLLCLSVICLLVLICRYSSCLSSFVRRPLSLSVFYGHDDSSLAVRYLLVYSIVMAADWLQGPYAYRLYRDEYGNSEQSVAFLFVLGFASAGVSAKYVGKWADIYGRKLMCLCFCASYSTSCILVLYPGHYSLLVPARILGGFSTSILFSVFETWLVARSNALGVSSNGLSQIFGTASLLNGLVATLAGLFSNVLVDRYSTCKAPFIASAVTLWTAGICIYYFWEENYGSDNGNGYGSVEGNNSTSRYDHIQPRAYIPMFKDLKLVGIAMIQTLFESSMYLFVFQWVPTMDEAQDKEKIAGGDLPLGLVFSFFMVSMMLGSQAYSFICGGYATTSSNTTANMVALHSRLCAIICALAGGALAYASTMTNLTSRFYGFSVFEACVGMYFPIVGFLKSRIIIDEERRGYLTALIRLPLNIVVAVILLTGFEEKRERVFIAITLMLVTASGISVLISD